MSILGRKACQPSCKNLQTPQRVQRNLNKRFKTRKRQPACLLQLAFSSVTPPTTPREIALHMFAKRIEATTTVTKQRHDVANHPKQKAGLRIDRLKATTMIENSIKQLHKQTTGAMLSQLSLRNGCQMRQQTAFIASNATLRQTRRRTSPRQLATANCITRAETVASEASAHACCEPQLEFDVSCETCSMVTLSCNRSTPPPPYNSLAKKPRR